MRGINPGEMQGRREDPGLCWVSWLFTASVGESQWRALCACAVGAWGEGSSRLQHHKNFCHVRPPEMPASKDWCPIHSEIRAGGIRVCCGCLSWAVVTLQRTKGAQAFLKPENSDTTAEAMKIQASMWTIQKLSQASSCLYKEPSLETCGRDI